jgi:SAM-dependent methyltransferase
VSQVTERTALQAYGDALALAVPLLMRFEDGVERQHDVSRWIAAADAVDGRLLDRCAGPTLDLGCGPGRLLAALAERGIPALGVDISAPAVAMARARGGVVIRRSLFDPLPGEGRWAHALLIDGNIGIGGDPIRLLRRVAALLAPGGELLAELSADNVDRRGRVRLRLGSGRLSEPFPWAELGAQAMQAAAQAAGLQPAEYWQDGGRAFALLRSPSVRARSVRARSVRAISADDGPERA